MNTGAAGANTFVENQAGPLAASVVLTEPPSSDERLIQHILEATGKKPTPAASRLDQFLREPSGNKALLLWLGRSQPVDKEQLVRRLNQDVAYIDRLLNEQVNAILHHPALQRLEASWRGLAFLTQRADEQAEQGIKIRVLNASWKELERDFERAVEFDQSQLFKKVYEQEFGSPGGEPFAALVGDFEIEPRPSASHPHDDLSVLKSLSHIAAAAFCPFITNVSPTMFGLDDFQGLEHRLDHARTFDQLDYLKWRAFRETEDARFVGLTLPRALMRLPYENDGSRVDRFCFQEDVAGPDQRKYLWGGAAYAMAGVLVRAFAQAGWLADIRGVQRGLDGGGLVTGLPVHSFSTDKQGIAPKCSTDIIITDELEKQLSDLGFIPLCHCQDTEHSAFYSNQSAQKPKAYDRQVATVNARMSSMLRYMFCVSRFAHYIKVLGRDKIGSFAEAEEFEKFLQAWIVQYVTVDPEASADVKSRFPLREAQVQVRPNPGKPGSYQCVMHLLPHYELDELSASVRVVTELNPSRVT